jgi:hypothetical protein
MTNGTTIRGKQQRREKYLSTNEQCSAFRIGGGGDVTRAHNHYPTGRVRHEYLLTSGEEQV